MQEGGAGGVPADGSRALDVTSPTQREIGAKNENVWGKTNEDYEAVPDMQQRVHNQALQAGAQQFLLDGMQENVPRGEKGEGCGN